MLFLKISFQLNGIVLEINAKGTQIMFTYYCGREIYNILQGKI